MRKFILSLAVVGGVSVLGVGPASAGPMRPDAACNQGTMNAHDRAPEHASGHQHIPHMMDMGMGPMCMSM